MVLLINIIESTGFQYGKKKKAASLHFEPYIKVNLRWIIDRPKHKM